MRLEFDISKFKEEQAEHFLKQELSHVISLTGLAFKVDNELVFSEDQFGPHNGWAKYANGEVKSATLRYKSGLLRIPHSAILPVYSTKEFELKQNPRGKVFIPKIIICKFEELNYAELMADGLQKPNGELNLEQAVNAMKEWYPDITSKSIVSYYKLGEAYFSK